jgi:hypothetical protein
MCYTSKRHASLLRRGLLAQDKTMSKRTRTYRQGEIGELKVVDDFLPPPSELVLREDTVKVTLALSRRRTAPARKARGRG